MKRTLLLISVVIFSPGFTNGQITVSGSANDGTYTSFTKVSGVFNTLNNTAQTGGNIVITITADVTDENGGYGLGNGNWASLTIQPSGNRTISGPIVVGEGVLSFNGAKNITVNGLNSGGNSLTISNPQTWNVGGTSTINFVNDASNITITNCTILGSATVYSSAVGGNIYFGPGLVTGNDNITISNCKIGPAGTNPNSRGIYSNEGSGVRTNSNITITNCEIYDYYYALGCHAIWANNGTSDWIISNNKIYQSVPRAMSGPLFVIAVSNTTNCNNIEITGNTIGYGTSAGTGTLTLTGTSGFRGISISIGNSSGTATGSVTSNVISDISTVTVTSYNCYGIENNSSPESAIVDINNNTIRNITTTLTGTIYAINSGGTTTGGLTVNVKDNLIENISRANQGIFTGIGIGKGTDFTISGNTIRNLSVNNTSAGSNLYGIETIGKPDDLTIRDNIITGLTTTSASSIQIKGIHDSNGNGGKKTFKNNSITNLSANGIATITGIFTSAGSSPDPYDMSGNIILSLTGGKIITGIYLYNSSGSINFNNNRISNLTSSVSSATTVVTGADLYGFGPSNVANNIIGSLNASASSSKNGVVGISLKGGPSYNVYYNTVYLNASSSSVTVFGTSCIYYDSYITSLDLRNNILVNLSAPAQEGANSAANGMTVCLRHSGGTEGVAPVNYSLTSDNNLFWANSSAGSNNHLVFVEGPQPLNSTITNMKNSLAVLKSFLATREQHSIEENPVFLSTTGSDPDYLKPSTITGTGIESGGAGITSYIYDIYGTIRQGNAGYTGSGTAPDIGAIEFDGTGIPTFTSEQSADRQYQIWSSTGIIKIHIPSLTGKTVGIELYDLAGRLIRMQRLPLEAPTEISVTAFKGIGIVKVRSGREVYSAKVILK